MLFILRLVRQKQCGKNLELLNITAVGSCSNQVAAVL
jgi:hypothetical protein